jgi:hypothetical protein
MRRFTSYLRRYAEARLQAEAALDREVAAAISAARSSKGVHGASKLRPMVTLASINGCQPQTGMEQRVLRRAAVPAAALIAEGEVLYLLLWMSVPNPKLSSACSENSRMVFGFFFHGCCACAIERERKEWGCG